METSRLLKKQLKVHRNSAVQFLSFLVAAHGLYILSVTLLAQIAAHRGTHLNDLAVDIPLLIGLSLLYLSSLLRRRKRTAWLVTIMAYTFYLGLEVTQLVGRMRLHDTSSYELIGLLLLPLAVLGLLMIFQEEFVVKSDIQGFRFAARFAAIILSVAFLYGVAGFMLLDRSDFREEISPVSAVHYTIDQFNITTEHPLKPHTKRSQLFLDSLSFVSLAAIAYAVLSLFQPLRSRLVDHHADRERMEKILSQYGAQSEEFFKLWPQDKQYFFSNNDQSALAFHVYRGVALCLGGPIGESSSYQALMKDFKNLCFGNDWLPALVHVEDTQRQLYERQGYDLQKLGEEAVVDINNFQTNVLGTKYFRQIINKFTKQDFTSELLLPPHNQAVMDRLSAISEDWLAQAGRTERGFVMGYYSPEYMQMCRIMVARDAASTIQAFINIVPADFSKEEATYDLLRHTKSSPGNINDFLLIQLMHQLAQEGFTHLNMGLCPLVGLDEADDEKNRLIDSVLRFAYVNGDRFYSFSGLHRFKAKYQPEWRDRYIAYHGGLRGFTRALTVLMRIMRV